MVALLSPKNDTAVFSFTFQGKMYFLEDYICLLHFKNTFLINIYLAFIFFEFFQSTNHIRRPGLITLANQNKKTKEKLLMPLTGWYLSLT